MIMKIYKRSYKWLYVKILIISMTCQHDKSSTMNVGQLHIFNLNIEKKKSCRLIVDVDISFGN